ncbi:DUF5362 domain-containing protein [Sebaldella sp. S0638]|uniref:DUF5362 domain-containing protein n=1 Tax=Sebaldella sp. S0638 TaxID=2957809 RepID=UPI00209F0936|nr:DUF5362 domain-containing protein [Sebaldella sp. S0638]MCP1226178.1 DUF5362 domain-containing protein [Sebaldella sp. S0638]
MNDLEELYSKSNFDTSKEKSMTVQLDEIFKKKLRFLGTFQQVIGILGIIYGAFACIGIITAIIGVPVIIIGLKVFKAGGAYKASLLNANGEELKNALCETSDAAKLYLIVLIVFIVLYILFFIIIMVVMIAALSQSNYYY